MSESITSSYPSTCTNPVTCNQPTWTRDAKGNETDYTYDSTHGGVLTVTLPADQNSRRRKTFNTYTTYDTGYGLIYRLTRSETCGLNATQLSTLTACPATTATSVTMTDYGTSTTAPYTYKSFMPYSVTQTDGAGSVSATTTYTYDIIGNVITVDGPAHRYRRPQLQDLRRQPPCHLRDRRRSRRRGSPGPRRGPPYL
ncbi:MAG: hypothetical protein WDN06_16215 [Asticcacaulis sp.]